MSKGPTFPMYVRLPQPIHERLQQAASTNYGSRIRGKIAELVVDALDKHLPPLTPANATEKKRRKR